MAVPTSTTSPLTLGVDIGGDKIAMGAVAGDGRIVAGERYLTGADRGPGAVIAELAGRVRRMERERPGALAAVGVGVCGQIDRQTGILRAAPSLPGWSDVPLRDRLEAALERPVAVANDVDLIALGEWRYGAEPDAEELVVVYVGTGVGAGIVTGGRMLVGCGYAAEIGHATIVVDGRHCRCGNPGCLEAYVGGWAIAERARDAVVRDPAGGARLREIAGGTDGIRAETVARAHAEGDPLAGRLVRDTGHFLGAGMVGVVNAFNPHRLVLGGGVVDGLPELIAIVSDHLRRFALHACTAGLTVAAARLGRDAGILGAALLARQRLHAAAALAARS